MGVARDESVMDDRPCRAHRSLTARMGLIARALVAACLPGDWSGPLAQADHEDELVGNAQLREASPEKRQLAREEASHRAVSQIYCYRRGLGFSFIVLASAVLLAVALVHGVGIKPSSTS